MTRVAFIFLCVQAILLQQTLAAPACLQVGNGLVLPSNLQVTGLNYASLPGNQVGNQLCNLPSNLVIEQGCNQVVTELVPSLQCGDVSVTGDLPIGGTIRVSGCFPIYGVVAVDGAVPSSGTAVVNHSCGSPC